MNSVEVESVEQLQAMLQRRAPSKVLASGSKTSKNPCFVAQDTELQLGALSKMERIGPSTVRVGAGVVLRDLLRFLARHELALPTIGEWSGQTIAGAMSTGTHGGSFRHGSLCTSVVELTLVDGTGKRRTFGRGDSELALLLPSFGVTGVLVSLVLQCEPRFRLALGRRCFTMDHYLRHLVVNPEAVEFQAALWLPAARRVVSYSARRIGHDGGPHQPREVRFNKLAMVWDGVTRKSRELPSHARWSHASGALGELWSRATPRLFPSRNWSGHYEQILAPLQGTAAEILRKRRRNRTPPEGEFAVRRDRVSELIVELEQLFVDANEFPHRPVGLRPNQGEGGALAPSQGRDCVWVSLFLDPKSPLSSAVPSVLERYDARPHWGKALFMAPRRVPRLYPRWNEFREFRRQMDPAGLFLNSFAAELGLD